MAEGTRDAATFAHNNTNHPYNVHLAMNPPRALVFCFILGLAWVDYTYTELLSIALSMFLIWPYFHNGSYYEGRRLIDGVKDYNFFSQSQTTTAVLSFKFKYRAFMCLCGIISHLM